MRPRLSLPAIALLAAVALVALAACGDDGGDARVPRGEVTALIVECTTAFRDVAGQPLTTEAVTLSSAATASPASPTPTTRHHGPRSSTGARLSSGNARPSIATFHCLNPVRPTCHYAMRKIHRTMGSANLNDTNAGCGVKKTVWLKGRSSDLG